MQDHTNDPVWKQAIAGSQMLLVAFGALVHYATTETWTTDLEDAYAIGPGHTQATGMTGLLTRVSWLEMRKPLASITTALSLHIVVVPSVFEAANYNLRQASRAIVLGSLLALLLTVAWQAVVFSSMPLSDHGPPLTGPRLLEGLREVAGMSLPLFSLLALGGSMLGLGLGCVDWALDAARSVEDKDKGKGSGGLGRGEAVGLVLAPCVVAAMLAPTHVHAASGLLRTAARPSPRLTGNTGAPRPGNAEPSSYSAQGMMATYGNFYAIEVEKALGLEEEGGLLRVGFMHYTTTEEVDRLLAALDRA